jgi:hypothetical protein
MPFGTWSLRLALLLLPLLTGAALAARPLHAWRTIDTPHFQVHYPEDLQALAFRAARLCEEAHEKLVPLLGHAPAERTQVLLTDYGDSANGSATALPYPKVHLFAAPPDMDGNLHDYDDWLRILIFHEYAHILHLDTKSGLPAILNRVLGRTFMPNQNMPSFILEGTAVWLESFTSGRGRIHSAVFRGILRVQALAGRLLDIDSATHVPLEWPGANVWYLYGGHFLDWIARNRGTSTAASLNAAVGDDLLPFAPNAAAREATGETLTALWRAWQADLTARARAERDALAAEPGGLTAPRLLTTTGRDHRNPRYHVDGRLLSLDVAADRSGGVWSRAPGAAEDDPARVLTGQALSAFDLCRDGRTLLFDQQDRFEGDYVHYDLVAYDLERRRPRRLTRGARVREPACAPDGTWAAAVQLDHGRSRLVRVDLGTGEVATLYDPGGIDQMAFPVVSPDGGTIVATRVAQGRGRDLVAVDVATGAVRTLTDDPALELHPRFTADGRWLVYVSDITGIYDVYARRWADGATHRLTRLVGGALEVDVSPDGRRLAMRVITPGGYDLAEAPFEPETPLAAGRPRAPSETRAAAPDRPLPERDYAPLDTLWPVAWSPAFTFSSAEDAASQLGLTVDANDAAGHHLLIGNLQSVPEDDSLSATLVYGYRRLVPALTLSAGHATRTRANGAYFGAAPRDWRDRATNASASVSYPFGRAAHAVNASVRLGYSRTDPAENPDPVHDPLDKSPQIPGSSESTDVVFGLRYASLDTYPEAISIGEGFSFATTVRLRDRRIGGEADTFELFVDYAHFFPLWWRHVLALRLNGAIGRGDAGRGVFFGLGSVPEPRNILLDALDNISFGSNVLRGYPSGTERGDRFLLAKLDYRMPLWDVFRGPSTAPLFFRRLKLALFTDWGQARTSPEEISFAPDEFRRAVGAEIASEATLGWRLPVNVRVGYAEGLDADGETQVYVFLGSWF